MQERITQNPDGSKHIVITDDQGNIIQDTMTAPTQTRLEIHRISKPESLSGDFDLGSGGAYVEQDRNWRTQHRR